MKFVIPIPEKISFNKIYAGFHWTVRAKHKDDYRFAVMSIKPKPYNGPFPVHTHYHFKLRGKPLDISNHAYMQKLTEDSLVVCGVIPDDSQKYVSGINITAEKVKNNEDELVIVELSTGI